MLEPPSLDSRSFEDIVLQTEALAQRYSAWRPRSDGTLDLGGVLIRLFGRMLEPLLAELNGVPQLHRLAFTNLLGAQRVPPRAARVPLTFTPAEGQRLVEVPAGARVSASAPSGEVTFETEQRLPVTRAVLQAVFVRDVAARSASGEPLQSPEDQRYADRTERALGLSLEPFLAFAADKPVLPRDDANSFAIEHELYIDVGDPERFAGATVTLNVAPADANAASVFSLQWDPIVTAQPRVPPSFSPSEVTPETVNGQQGYWLRAAVLKSELSPPAMGASAGAAVSHTISLSFNGPPRTPDVAFYNGEKLDLSRDFRPFGERPQTGDALYIGSTDGFGGAGGTVSVTLTKSMAGIAGAGDATLKLTWSALTSSGWSDIAPTPASSDSNLTSSDLTMPVTLSLPLPKDRLPLAIVNGTESRWLRLRIESGNYGHDIQASTSAPVTITPANFAAPVLQSVQVSRSGAVTLAPRAVLRRTGPSYERIEPLSTDAASVTVDPVYRDLPEDRIPPTSSLNLGLDRPFEAQLTTLYFQVVPAPEPSSASDFWLPPTTPPPLELLWEYTARADADTAPAGWKLLSVEDGTRRLTQSGLVRFTPPEDWVAFEQFGATLYWLRLRPNVSPAMVAERVLAPARALYLGRVLTNTVWAEQRVQVQQQALGGSNGARSQSFELAQNPALVGQAIEVNEPQAPTGAELLRLQAEEGSDVLTPSSGIDPGGTASGVWVRWHEVPDFWASGPRDRHYLFDAHTGRVTFGDGVSGMIPLLGTQNIRANYRAGGGADGNLPAGALTSLKTSVPGVESVTHYEPAAGGAPVEAEAAFLDRASRTLRHRQRAVTAEDYADLALEASTEIARAVTIPPGFSPIDQADGARQEPEFLQRDGQVLVVIIPRDAQPGKAPLPALVSRVFDFLAARCPIGTQLHVVGPTWVRVTIGVRVAPQNSEVAEAVQGAVQAAILALLHPVTGGDGNGWEFGRPPRESDLAACILAVPGVEHVEALQVRYDDDEPFGRDQAGAALTAQELGALKRLLAFADQNSVTVNMRAAGASP